MLMVPAALQVYAKLGATDMRKGFDGLTGIVEHELGRRIEEGDLFLFFNRRRNRLKVLFFTGDGTVILYKRLERGTFETLRSAEPSSSSSADVCLTLTLDQLHLLLEGIELSSIKRRKWWRREEAEKIPPVVSQHA